VCMYVCIFVYVLYTHIYLFAYVKAVNCSTYIKDSSKTEIKIQLVFGEDQFAFRCGKAVRGKTGMMTVVLERTFEILVHLETCDFFFIDWKKAFDCVNWTELT
jgi:hypothetical protein